MGNGWYRLSITFLSDQTYAVIYMASADGTASYAGTGTEVYLWGASYGGR